MDTTKPIVYVEWVDAVADNGWASGTKAEVHECKTVGFLITKQSTHYALPPPYL